MEDLKQSWLAMREHAITNRLLEIHLPRIACGENCMNLAEVRELLLNVFRNTPLRVTIHVLAEDSELNSQTDHFASTLQARADLNQTENQCEGKTSSGESMLSKETAEGGIPNSEVNESTVVYDTSRIQDAFSKHVREGPPREAESGIVSTQVHLASPLSETPSEKAPSPCKSLKRHSLSAPKLLSKKAQ